MSLEGGFHLIKNWVCKTKYNCHFSFNRSLCFGYLWRKLLLRCSNYLLYAFGHRLFFIRFFCHDRSLHCTLEWNRRIFPIWQNHSGLFKKSTLDFNTPFGIIFVFHSTNGKSILNWSQCADVQSNKSVKDIERTFIGWQIIV